VRVAAAHGRLGVVVRAAMLEGRQRPRPGGISGAQALSRLQELRGRWQDAELKARGLV
jgi:hypothetical protein